MPKAPDKTPKPQETLLQIRLTEAEKRQIKVMAATHGMTLRQATLAAFTAWSEKLRTRPGKK